MSFETSIACVSQASCGTAYTFTPEVNPCNIKSDARPYGNCKILEMPWNCNRATQGNHRAGILSYKGPMGPWALPHGSFIWGYSGAIIPLCGPIIPLCGPTATVEPYYACHRPGRYQSQKRQASRLPLEGPIAMLQGPTNMSRKDRRQLL